MTLPPQREFRATKNPVTVDEDSCPADWLSSHRPASDTSHLHGRQRPCVLLAHTKHHALVWILARSVADGRLSASITWTICGGPDGISRLRRRDPKYAEITYRSVTGGHVGNILTVGSQSRHSDPQRTGWIHNLTEELATAGREVHILSALHNIVLLAPLRQTPHTNTTIACTTSSLQHNYTQSH